MSPAALSLRGVAIGIQRPDTGRDGIQYDYLFTPDTFPWLYDRGAWTHTLNRLQAWGFNAVFFWTGHPFTSLLTLEDWPDARELPPAQVARNMETFHWLCTEGQRRGIRMFMQFYNIHLSHALARARGVPIQQHLPSPLAHDYTQYVVKEFVRTYPNIGLHVCLGEALSMEPGVGPGWLADTILPAVIQGARAGGHPHPPVMVREHHVDIKAAMARGLPVYDNLLTEQKYNGEVITTPEPRGWEWELHRETAALGVPHVINVHLLGDLEPFRFGATDFIRRCCQSMVRIGAAGLHLYPLRYFDWPNAPDAAAPPLPQIDRDWMWFEAWGRYAQDPDRDPRDEAAYWDARLAQELALAPDGAAHLRQALACAGHIPTRGLRHVGVTIGGRQAWQLGMTLSQLLNRKTKWMPYPQLWECYAPPAGTTEDYIEQLVSGAPFAPPTPIEQLVELMAFADAAGYHLAALPPAARTDGECARYVRDVEALVCLARYYDHKVRAAIHLGVFLKTAQLEDLRRAEAELAASLEPFRALAENHQPRYRDARASRIPYCTVPFGADKGYVTWPACLAGYEHELAALQAARARMQALPDAARLAHVRSLAGDVDAFLEMAAAAIGADIGAKRR